jgi:hypothetical protein
MIYSKYSKLVNTLSGGADKFFVFYGGRKFWPDPAGQKKRRARSPA